MQLVIIVGPQAVGKMTVGQEIAKKTGLKLFHNHVSIDFALQYAPYGTDTFNGLVDGMRRLVFEEVSRSDGPGLIFTYVWDFNDPENRSYLDELVNIFRRVDAKIRVVELEADMETRLDRNHTENRLREKPSKRNIAFTERDIRDSTAAMRLNSREGDYPKDYEILKINNTRLSPVEVANAVIGYYKIDTVSVS